MVTRAETALSTSASGVQSGAHGEYSIADARIEFGADDGPVKREAKAPHGTAGCPR